MIFIDTQDNFFFNCGINQLYLAQESVAPSNLIDSAIFHIPLPGLTFIRSIGEMHTFYRAFGG